MRAIEPVTGATLGGSRMRIASKFPRPPRWLMEYSALFLGALALAWFVAGAWWLLLPPQRTVSLDIPPGTAVRIAAGAASAGLPDSLTVRVGDTLVVQNNDTAPHYLAGQWIPAGTSARIPVSPAFFDPGTERRGLNATSALVCSFHPGGALAVFPRSRPSPLVSMPIALIAGIPLGTALVIATALARRLRLD